MFWSSGNMELPEPASKIHSGTYQHRLDSPIEFSLSKRNHYLGLPFLFFKSSGLLIVGLDFILWKMKDWTWSIYLPVCCPGGPWQWPTLRREEQQELLSFCLANSTVLAMNVRHKPLSCLVLEEKPSISRYWRLCKLCKSSGTVGGFLRDKSSYPYGPIHSTLKPKISPLHSFLGKLDPALWPKGVLTTPLLACGSVYFTA